jgi:hypothetical protein
MIEKNVVEQYVDDDRTDEGQAEWSETSAQQNQTTADLKTFHGVKIMAGDERIHKVSGQTGWRWRHGDEIKKCVQPEYKKYEPQQSAGDDDGDFHGLFFGSRDIPCYSDRLAQIIRGNFDYQPRQE